MINYDLTKIRAIIFDVDGVLSGSTIGMYEDGQPARTINIKDGYAIQLAVKSDLLIAIVSGGRSRAVEVRYENLGVQEIHMGAAYKTKEYALIKEKYALKDEEIIFMGDDIPDYEVMKCCGLPCCPADAAPEIKEISLYISHFAGGQGCGRDVIEQVMKAQGKWMSHQKAFGW